MLFIASESGNLWEKSDRLLDWLETAAMPRPARVPFAIASPMSNLCRCVNAMIQGS